jgi:hypothetical protein
VIQRFLVTTCAVAVPSDLPCIRLLLCLYDRPLDARRLVQLIDHFGVKPVPFKVNSEPMKGYQITGKHGSPHDLRALLGVTDHYDAAHRVPRAR